MKTKEELNTLREEINNLNKKLVELTEEELEQVFGGFDNTEAAEAVKTVDNALQRALNQEASIGADKKRMDFTGSNLTTGSENLTPVGGLGPDIDLTKEIMGLTNNNMLMEAARRMLEKANQQN